VKPETIGHRSVRIPKLMRLVDSPVEAVEELAALGRDSRFLVVHAGAASPTGYGETLVRAAERAGLKVGEAIALSNTDAWAQTVRSAMSEQQPHYVVGVGGGRVVDVAKVAAAHAGIDFVSVPTQASSDGICSPVAVMVDDSGRPRSVAARIPVAIIVDMTVISGAPEITWRAGLGDLVSNLSAVKDWRLASKSGEPYDDFACLVSEAAALSVIDTGVSLTDPFFREKLVRGLILSGIAMEMAGSSRPASGSEHLISHALDTLLTSPHPHGLQVAVGMIAADLIRGDDVTRLVGYFRSVGLPVHPRDLGIPMEILVAAIRQGPEQRPGRTSILDGVTDEQLDRLVVEYQQL
jgi:glycerol-1-phosphate dehydrogenase [NAD(P)+]